jgi:protein-L-isoaspartate(D-aspartate) O-methyltransferase
MVERQLRGRDITNESVLAAMERVPRHELVPDEVRPLAYADSPLPIGHDQTISQPYIVAFMTQALKPKPGDKVLEIGTGSGYQAAVLAELGADVVTIERVPELAERAREALAAAGYERVEVLVGDGSQGVPERAPFDGIAVAAAAPAPPAALYEQLRPGGRLVVPVGPPEGQWLEIVVRGEQGPVRQRSVPCVFVPLIGADGFAERKAG